MSRIGVSRCCPFAAKLCPFAVGTGATVSFEEIGVSDLQAQHVIVCDDEAELRQTVGEYLERRGFRVTLAADGRTLDTALSEGAVDLVVLDITMPGEDGLSILRRLRQDHDVAVIMLTASSEMVDRVVGLELGADDYLGKPVQMRELVARIRSVLRRVGSVPGPVVTNGNGIPVGPYLFDQVGAELRDRSGRVVPLTPMEFRTLALFVENPRRVLSRDRLLELAEDRGWEAFDRSIDLRVSRLRRKIERDPAEPSIIRTVRGLGYVFDPSPS